MRCIFVRVEVRLEPMNDDDGDVAMHSQRQTLDENPFSSLQSDQQQRQMDVDSGIVTTMEVDETEWGQRVVMHSNVFKIPDNVHFYHTFLHIFTEAHQWYYNRKF